MIRFGAQALAALGPGLLFAATAIGVSHLVQSTRAGEQGGLALFGLVVSAFLVKYPAFRFGPHYAAATGKSLLQGYRRQGRWALATYGLVTVGTMFTVQAAVTLVTTSLLLAVVGVRAHPVAVSAVLIVIFVGVLTLGQYRWLDRVIKLLVVLLTLSTLLAAALTLGRVNWGTLGWGYTTLFYPSTVGFSVALVGWMPTGLDVSVWQSLWVVARSRDTQTSPHFERTIFDFHVGYIGTAFLALCFMILGAGLLYDRGMQLPASVPGFARGLIDVYATQFGEWSRPIMGVSAFVAMASTTLAVLDGFPRALSAFVLRWTEDEAEIEETTGRSGRIYWVCLGLLVGGSLLVMAFLLTSLRALVDIATTLSFVTAPVFCFLNHRAVFSDVLLPEAKRPSRGLWVWSWVGIVLQVIFAGWFLYSF